MVCACASSCFAVASLAARAWQVGDGGGGAALAGHVRLVQRDRLLALTDDLVVAAVRARRARRDAAQRGLRRRDRVLFPGDGGLLRMLVGVQRRRRGGLRVLGRLKIGPGQAAVLGGEYLARGDVLAGVHLDRRNRARRPEAERVHVGRHDLAAERNRAGGQALVGQRARREADDGHHHGHDHLARPGVRAGGRHLAHAGHAGLQRRVHAADPLPWPAYGAVLRYGRDGAPLAGRGQVPLVGDGNLDAFLIDDRRIAQRAGGSRQAGRRAG